MDSFGNQELLTMADVLQYMGMSRTTFKRLRDSPEGKAFPLPVKLGNMVRWRKSDLVAFVRLLPTFHEQAPKK